MAFDGNEGEEITLKEGAAMTAAYRREHPKSIKARFFGREILEKLLSQDGSMGIRMYFGTNEKKETELILVSADKEENDILSFVADKSIPCPPYCGKKNELNS